MAILTDEQIHAIRQIIEDHHSAFVVNTVGAEAVAKDVLERLQEKGLINVKVASIEESYIYGQILAAMDDPKLAKMDYSEFQRHLRQNPQPLSAPERRAMELLQHRTSDYIRQLGNRITLDVSGMTQAQEQAYRQRIAENIADQTQQNIARRESIKKLKSDLLHSTTDWGRNWNRVAVTEKHNAMQRGLADHLYDTHGRDVRVSKRPTPDACPHCKRLYLGSDGHPRIFKLADLEANGTNVGRKVADWLPVVGSTHPHCQCQLIRIPDGWGYDADGSLVPGGEFGEAYDNAQQLKLSLRAEANLRKAFQTLSDITFQGIPIAIENKAGTKRKWRDSEGGEGETLMLYAYGYVKNTSGNDDDELDVFIGPSPNSKNVFGVSQQDPATGIYDEDKWFLGFTTKEEVRIVYQMHYNRPDFYLTMTKTDIDGFKRICQATKPSKGHMAKSGPALVIDLQKADTELKTLSGNIETNFVDSRHSSRNPSYVSGDAANVFYDVPRTSPHPPAGEVQSEYLDAKTKRKRKPADGNWLDRDAFAVLDNRKRKPHHIDLETFRKEMEDAVSNEDIEANRKKIEARAKAKKGPKNQQPRENPATEDPDLSGFGDGYLH